MESAKLFLSLILLFSSWVFMGFSQGIGGGLGGDSSCVTKLIPCQSYLKDPSAPPPTCCAPLKAMITDDTKCLCGLFNNPDVLKNLNITQEDLLKVAKGCGITVDDTVCKKAAGAPTSTPATSTVPEKFNGTNGNSTDSPTKKNSADGISPIGGLCFIATFGALVLSAV